MPHQDSALSTYDPLVSESLSHPVMVIQPSSGWRAVDFRELWAYRELLYIFAWRDIKVRYRQTLLGAVWVLGQPLITMIIFTLLFNRVAKLQSGSSVPYPLFVLSGVLLWNFFSGTVNHAGNSLLGASYLISKVYFPRLLIPLSNVATELVDFAVAALLLAAMMVNYRVFPSATFLLVPIPLAICTLLAVGIGFWVAALNVEYRDVRVIIPFLLQLAMYVTPVVYPLAALPERYRKYAQLNPMSGVIEAFRGTVLGQPFSLSALVWPAIASIVMLVSGAYYFRRMERLFADVL
jgi:lipopolysaccharide transport system permease protein